MPPVVCDPKIINLCRLYLLKIENSETIIELILYAYINDDKGAHEEEQASMNLIASLKWHSC